MAESTGPFIVVDGNDVSLFATRDDAENWLEAVDVAEGTYTVYNADGTQLALAGHGNRVQIGPPPTGKGNQELLVRALRTYLAAVPSERRSLASDALTTARLDRLVAELVEVEQRFGSR